jgi:type I restriction enzyme S subunit
MKSIALVIPESPDEARKAVTHLDRETARIDALIEKKTRFIELLREKRQALITHTVTKGLDPSVKMKNSGVEWLGEVPEHWAVKRLKFIAAVQTGIAKGKDNAEKDTVEVPYLRVANVQDGYLDLDEVATIEVSTADLPRYLLQPGDVLMNEGGDFDKLGRGHVWHGEIEPCIHQNHVFAVRPHGVSSEWLNTFTSSAAAQFYFMGRSKQSTNLASISSSNLMELAVPLPSEEEQRLILDGLHRQASQVNALLAQTERSIELLKERRSALITAAVTGQIDLREAN